MKFALITTPSGQAASSSSKFNHQCNKNTVDLLQVMKDKVMGFSGINPFLWLYQITPCLYDWI